VTETSANGKTTEGFSRKRHVGFPWVALPDAVQVLKKAGRHGNKHSSSAFATYMGLSTENSGTFKRRLAGFRDWKLVTGRGDWVVLTELGQRIAYPTDPDKELQDLQEAFRNSEVFSKVWEEAAKDEPYNLATLANIGVRYGVNPGSKERFAESLRKSAVAAGFAKSFENDKIVFILPDEVEDGAGSFQGEEKGDGRGHQQDEPPPPPPPPPPPSTAALLRQEWLFPGGKVVLEIHSDRPLPAHAYAKVGSIVSESKGLADLLSNEDEDEVIATDDNLEG
jgi:hypothetical protein